MKIRKTAFLSLFPLFLFALASCDTTTDLEDVSVDGRWDSVGALQSATSGLALELDAGANGQVTGTWQSGGTSSAVVDGVWNDRTISFTLAGFHGGARFEGELTDAFRMEGTLDGLSLEGPAVFRRSSFR